jgi:radical SAM protein with 4Fe4S-binding SPASM domain
MNKNKLCSTSLIDQSIADFQKNYDTVGPYYLSEFYQTDGDKKLYNFLTSVYQPKYNTNFRILIVQDCADVYDYQDLPGSAICALQKYASQIDISNFFIVVITGNKNIDDELTQVQKLYSTDICKIQSHIVHDIEYNTFQQQQDTFCVLPWIHLYIGPDGNVLPCCVADQKFTMGNVNNTTVDEILKSSEFNLLRTNMLTGKRSKECKRCYVQEDAGLKSPRQFHNIQWSQKKLNIDPDGTLKKFEPVYLDIRLSNICNLKCRMCSGYYSSAIAQEESILFGNQMAPGSIIQSPQKAMVLKEVITYLPHAEKIYFAGGEPLLASEHYKILNALIECGNTDLEIIYNTNFTSLVYKDISVLDLWKKFSKVTIGASLDAMGKTAEYVRHGTKWPTIESNLTALKQQCPHVNFTVTSTVGFLNIASLIELQKTWHETKLLDISKFSMQVIVGPDHLTLTTLPKEHKDQLDYKIKNHINWCYQNQSFNLAKQWTDVLQYMWSKDSSHFLSEFKRLTNLLDQSRSESLSTVLPEFSSFI